jgi:hypothetical protein
LLYLDDIVIGTGLNGVGSGIRYISEELNVLPDVFVKTLALWLMELVYDRDAKHETMQTEAYHFIGSAFLVFNVRYAVWFPFLVWIDILDDLYPAEVLSHIDLKIADNAETSFLSEVLPMDVKEI